MRLETCRSPTILELDKAVTVDNWMIAFPWLRQLLEKDDGLMAAVFKYLFM